MRVCMRCVRSWDVGRGDMLAKLFFFLEKEQVRVSLLAISKHLQAIAKRWSPVGGALIMLAALQ